MHRKLNFNFNRFIIAKITIKLVISEFFFSKIIFFRQITYLYIYYLNQMKKKEPQNKNSRSRSGELVKKQTIKTKTKSVSHKKQQPELFILLGDSFYVAQSKTQRKTYQQFEQKAKVSTPVLKKSRNRSKHQFNDSIKLQQYVKTLSKTEKEQLLKDLAQEFEPQNLEIKFATEKEDKLARLTEKLEAIRSQLVNRWDEQVSSINIQFENQQIGLQEKNEKINLVQRIRNNKISMINSAKVLFEKILKEQADLQFHQEEKIQHIINSLNSITSVQPLNKSYQPNIMNNNQGSESNYNDKQQYIEERCFEQKVESNIKIEDKYNQTLILNKETFKLDLRLDQVQFGRDYYDEIPLKIEEKAQQHKQEYTSKQAFKLQFSEPNLGLNLPQPTDSQFLCVGEQNDSKIKIPLLMTKDRLEQIQLQKTAEQIELLSNCIKARTSFQLSEIFPQNITHFTTLMDVNQFIIQFYEYVMKYYMMEVIQGMNLAYGKSCLDKLFMIRNQGYILDPDMDINNILQIEFLKKFHEDMTLQVRVIPEYQKIHNQAIFTAFNFALNVYRPYYELEGEFFPWNTSQKGLTFYEISEDNIDEVFQKTKLKVLECCSTLSGIIPNCQITTVQAKKLINKRNQDTYQKAVKCQIIQKYNDWAIKILNFQAMERVNLAQLIIQQEMELFVQQLTILSYQVYSQQQSHSWQ